MEKFFGFLYSIFQNVFGLPLDDYLWQTGKLFTQIGIIMCIITLIVALAYYYFIDHPRLNTWRGWLLFMASNAVINLIVGWLRVMSDFKAGLMVTTSQTTGESIQLDVDTVDCFNFGMSNAILSLVFFLIISFLVKWKSRNCSHMPHIIK